MRYAGTIRSTLFVLALCSLACDTLTPLQPSVSGGSGPSAPSGRAGSVTSLDYAAELALCVAETNRYRASVGRPPLNRSDALDRFAAEAAEHDAQVHQAHDYFKATNGSGVARAENEILWWRGFAVSEVVRQGLAQMWRSGPSGEHYDIIVGPYTQVGCGIYVNANEVTVAQDFR